MEKISKLIPILYEKNETNFNHNGLGKLTGVLGNEIEEVLNGQFEALFEYPANGRLADKIDNKMLVKAKPNRKDDPHVFRVYDYELDTITQTYLIYARSKNIDDLNGNMVLDVNVRNATPNQAWNQASNNALEPVNVRFESDISTTSSVHWERRNLLNIIAGEEGSMIQYWGGEIKHGNGWLWLYRRRGQDNVTTVRHGKNLSGLTATYSTKGLVTAIVPYYVDRGGQDEDDRTIYGSTVESQYINNYPHVYYDTVEYNDDDLGLNRDDEPEDGWSDSTIETALVNASERYFIEHTGIDLPAINMEIALEDISQTKEYEHFKDFEQIEIGDTITVYSKKFDLNVTAKARRVVYNGLTDKNEIVEVGTVSRSIYDDYKDLVDNRVDESVNRLQEGIDHAQTSANGKNTNYYGTADPNEAGLVGQENDTYFRTNGQEKELWLFKDGMWHIEIDDLTGERIKADVAEAQAEAETARTEADKAVDEINTAVANAGFTSLDETISSVQTISNQAQINSGTAIDNALEAMQQASQAVDNTGSLNIRVDEVENTLSVKADKQTVDDLTGVVDTHALDIKANAQGLALKANQDTVDTLSGTVSSLGTDVGVVAGQISSKVWNTDIETAIDGIEVGGRNLATKNSYHSGKTLYGGGVGGAGSLSNNNDRISYEVIVEPDTDYILTIHGDGYFHRLGEFPLSSDDFIVDHNRYNSDLKTMSLKTRSDTERLIISIHNNGKGFPIPFNEALFKLEKGTKATDWTPAPEDTDAKINHIETEWTQTFDTFSQTVSDIDGRVTSQKQTIEGMQDIVYDPETGLSSLNTQLANLVQVAVTGEEMTGAISVLENNINARVEKGELLSQINIEAERTLIQSDKLLLNANNTVITGTAWMDGAVIANASIDGAKIQDATIGSAKIASLDVGKISGNITNFVSSYWNNVNTQTSIDDRGINIYGSDQWRRTLIQETGFRLYNGSGAYNKSGAVGYFKTNASAATTDEDVMLTGTGRHAIGLAANNSHLLTLGYRTNNTSENQYHPALTIDPQQQGRVSIQSSLYMSSNPITNVSRLAFQHSGHIRGGGWGALYHDSEQYHEFAINGNVRFQVGNTVMAYTNLDMNGYDLPNVNSLTVDNVVSFNGGTIRTLNSAPNNLDVESINDTTLRARGSLKLVVAGNLTMHAALNSNGYEIMGASDRRLKTHINDSKLSVLEDYRKLNFVEYEWIDTERPAGVHFGLIAQDTPLFNMYDEENDVWGISQSQQVMYNSRAIQEMYLGYSHTAQVSESNSDKIHRLQNELSKANQRITELEGEM